MRTNQSVFIPREKILVLSGDQALATGALNTTGNTVNLQSAQGGVLSADQNSTTTAANNFITAGNTSLQVHKVKLVQGTPNSQNLSAVDGFNVGHKAYVESGILDARKIISVSTSLPELGVFDMQLMSGWTAPTVDINYDLGITLESHKRDAEFTLNKRDRMNVASHTITGSPTSPTDELLQTWAHDLNVNSLWVKGVKPFVVFGINTGGGAGTVINTITAATSVPFLLHDGVTYNFQSSITFVNSLTQAIAGGLAATATIEVLDKLTAGAAANVDALLVVGLDERQAVVFDDWTVTKVRVFADSGLAHTNADVALATEEASTGEQWYQRWKQIAAFDGATYNVVSHPYQLSQANLPSYMDRTALYTATVIEFEHSEQTITVETHNPHQVVILLAATVTNPTAAAGTAYTIATSDTTTITQLNASAGAWLSSASDNFSNIEYRNAATKAAPFV